MKRSFKTEGVVLKRRNFGEADKLLTVFTPFYGKIAVLAKGIRKIHSRKAPHLEVFSHVNLFIACGKSLDIVTEVETLETFHFLRTQLTRIAYAYRTVEEVDRLCAEKEVHKEIFPLLLNILRKLNDKKITNVEIIVEEFTCQLLWILGYLPRENILKGETLSRFLENVMERHLKSDSFLTKI